MAEVDRLTVKTVTPILPLEAARQALLALQHIEHYLALVEGDPRIAPLRDAIRLLDVSIKWRVNELGQDEFLGALMDSPDSTVANKLYWLRVYAAHQQKGAA